MRHSLLWFAGYLIAIGLFTGGIIVESVDLSLKFGMVAVLAMIWGELTELRVRSEK